MTRRSRGDTVPVSVRVSRSLRAEIERRREESGRTLSEEVEALLRVALDSKASDRLLQLRLDDGLWAWMRAVEKDGFFGTMEAAAIFFIRDHLFDMTGGAATQRNGWVRALVPLLPEPYRSANMAMLRPE